MGNIRDIKSRIGSIRNTRQITNAMKMVAAAKLRKAQQGIIKARPYADNINHMLATIKFKSRETDLKIFVQPEPTAKCALVVVTADRGLCGSFNSFVIKAALQYLKDHPNTDLFCIGKKGTDIFKKKDVKIIKSYTGLFNEMNFSVSLDIASDLKHHFFSNEYDHIEVIYNEFKSVIQQNIVQKQVLPIPDIKVLEGVSLLDYLYEPGEEEVIEELTNKYINVEIWRILLESSAAEQGTRMTAMDSATDNASDLIESLTLQYNMVRQAAITNEIIEIASGAEAQNQ
ncbi:MAG: ATP synthase F1 subunit gamma [Candidatus Cloacimonetes bacterium]|nr:ATP synthase F1 subunit gamma [Candidatus Cloacimonadota bacterium]